MIKINHYTIRSLSKLICVLTIIIYGILIFAFPYGNLLSYDVFGYYLYLPQTFIYNDPGISDLSSINEIIEIYNNSPTLYQVAPIENGNHIPMYPSGMAILYSPFFFIGHLLAYLFGYPQDGFSYPYILSFAIGYFVYTIIAICLIRKILLLYFSEIITSLTLIILFFGTNFYQIAIGGIGMPHMYLFVLFSLVIILTHNWYTKPRFSIAFLLGLIIGLMSITRPTEFIIIIIPIFFGIKSLGEVKERFHFLFTNKTHVILLASGIFLISLIQLIYWKVYTGNFFFYSYSNPGEGFNFTNPQIFNFLFSFRKGWFIYTPIMFIALFGFYKLYKIKHPMYYPILIFLIINIYILASWSCWWYAGSFSQRSVVQSYPLMAILIASLLISILCAAKIKKIISLFLVSALMYLNIFQTWQIHNGIIDPFRMTRSYYFAVFGKDHVPDGAQDLLLINRLVDGSENFSDTSNYHGRWIIQKEYSANYYIDGVNIYTDALEIPYYNITNKDHAWLEVYCEFKIIDSSTNFQPAVVRTFTNHKGEAYKYSAIDLLSNNHHTINGNWIIHRSQYLTPEVRSINDKFAVYLWIQGEGKLLIKSIKVRAYEPVN